MSGIERNRVAGWGGLSGSTGSADFPEELAIQANNWRRWAISFWNPDALQRVMGRGAVVLVSRPFVDLDDTRPFGLWIDEQASLNGLCLSFRRRLPGWTFDVAA